MTVSQARKYTAEYIRKHQLPLPNDNSLVFDNRSNKSNPFNPLFQYHP